MSEEFAEFWLIIFELLLLLLNDDEEDDDDDDDDDEQEEEVDDGDDVEPIDFTILLGTNHLSLKVTIQQKNLINV